MYEKNSAEIAMLIASIVALKSIQEHLKISTKSRNLPEPQTFENEFFQRETKIDNQTLAISCKQIAKEEQKQTKEHLARTENGVSSNAQIDQMWSCNAI